MNRNIIAKITVCASLALAWMPTALNAAQISGGISFAGDYRPVDAANNVTGDLTLAKSIYFGPSADYGGIGTSFVVQTAGDFVSVPLFSTTAMAPSIDVNPAGALPPGVLWSVGGFSLSLSLISQGITDSSSLQLSGSGTITAAGYDPTPGTWIATFNTIATTFSWSSSSASVPCPCTFSCPQNKTVECGQPWSFDAPTASDSCSNVTITVVGTVTNGSGCGFTATRTWATTDACGSPTQCSQTVTVIDTTAPTISCSLNKTVECGQPWAFDVPTASDSCSSVTITVGSTVTNGTACAMTVTRTWQATDACGNPAQCSQTVTITDTTAPVINCVSDRNVDCTNVWTFDAPRATDNCGSPAVTVVDTVTNTTTCGFKATRTWQAKDDCGNTARCSQTVTVTCAPCVPSTFNFTDGSALSGTFGNIRSFTTNGVSVKVSAFSRTKDTGIWETAYLGSYSGGLGVTDRSEGDGSNNRHTVDNIDRDNYVLFEFSEPVVVSRTYLGYVVSDSDLTLWIGTAADPYNNHLTLSDGVLTGFGYTEDNLTTDTTPRWADLNAGGVVGNAIVIAAQPGDITPEDQFKIGLLNICKRTCQTTLKLECVGTSGQVGVAYSSSLVASGGTPPYTFSIVSGSLPPGLTLNPTTGAITGTPTAAGAFTFTAKVTDSVGGTALSVCTAGCSSGPCTATWDFTTPSGCLGASQAYTSGGMTITTYGYTLAGQPVALFGKTDGGNENGLGICGEIDHEIDKDHAILIDLSDLINKGAQNAQMRIGSAQPGEGYKIYGSTDGTTIVLLLTGTLDYTYFPVPAYPNYKYIVVTADGSSNPAANVLLGGVSVNCGGPCSIIIGPPPCNGSICGSVLRDCDANGSLTGEAGLSGWTVTLKNGATTVGTATTAANGSYCFNGLSAGTYSVVVTPKPNYAVTAPSGCNHQQTVTLASCQNKTGVNFGYTGTAPGVNLVVKGPAAAICGDTITYTFYVTNTGNTCLYGGITVSDALLGGEIFHQTPVVPGQGYMFTKTYVVKSSDSGSLVNTAIAVGHPPGGLADVSKQVSVTTTVTCGPQPPSCFTCTGNNGCVNVSWTPCSGATSYNLKRCTTKGGPYTLCRSGVTATNCADTAVINGCVYYYVLCAVKNGIEGGNSVEDSAIPCAALPSPWNTKDIGVVGDTGGASYASGKFTVVGSGVDIWNSADEFRFAYQIASGDCSIVARVTSVGNTDPWAKAGVMIRETLTDTSKHVSAFVTPGNGVAAQARTTTGGASINVNTTGLSAPYWVKVVRTGSTFRTYLSSSGSTWTLMDTETVSMGSTVYIGLAVTSHRDGFLSPATFDGVTATP